jgi:SAM-dependent methyltransferase
MEEKIEILSPTILVDEKHNIDDLKLLANSLGLEFGWHYLLDISWILSQLNSIDSMRILDAGAGTGVLQWYLAENGAEVLSVDRASREYLPARFRFRFRAQGLRESDLAPALTSLRTRTQQTTSAMAALKTMLSETRGMLTISRSAGRVVIYNQDLSSMRNIADDTLDAVVAVSALEHNEPDDLASVVEDLLRVLKPGGLLVATLCAAKEQDWYHEPSRGWCYTADSLRKLFDLSKNTPDNYDRYDELFEALRICTELSDNLATFYASSGDNGMPWGLWDPQYQPVGVCKIKPHTFTQ